MKVKGQMDDMVVSEDELVSELWARDVRFILGEKPNHPPLLSPVSLISALAECGEARLQLSLIPLFLQHPDFNKSVLTAVENVTQAAQLTIKCFYTAAVWIERKHLLREHLPDLFSSDLGLSPTPNPDENLQSLATRQQVLSKSRINWLGTYLHAADIWLKEMELQKT